jgi:cellulose synthase/poly-beta-1,6-N-acetylglucosamine synthase-like glycosyltransferase
MPAATQAFDLSILTCCYKYLQRFRVFLDSIARQNHPVERIEVCVAAPGNPDGLMEYLDLFRRAHPKLSLRVAAVPESDRANRGKMINAAFRVSSAPVVMAADGDIVLPADFVRTVLPTHAPDRVVGCWRTPLDEEVTANVVTGNLDFQALFDAMRNTWSPLSVPGVRQGVLGYCQIVSRDAFAAVMYPEDFNSINQSDIVFVDRLQEKLGVMPFFLEKVFVLHLDHPRDWSGTKVFL